jgi:hypothetical protein
MCDPIAWYACRRSNLLGRHRNRVACVTPQRVLATPLRELRWARQTSTRALLIRGAHTETLEQHLMERQLNAQIFGHLAPKPNSEAAPQPTRKKSIRATEEDEIAAAITVAA